MDKRLFVTHPAYEPIGRREGWLSFYNDREHPLIPQNGILNVKKSLSLKKQ